MSSAAATAPASGAWEELRAAAERSEPALVRTRVRKIVGLLIESGPLRVPMGSRLEIRPRGAPAVPVELVGFAPGGLYLMPFGRMDGVGPGDEVVFQTSSQQVWLGEGLLGHVLDGTGRVIDAPDTPIPRPDARPLYREAPPALSREPIREPFLTGIKAWDGFLTIGRGQRLGVFAGTGVGKSILLGMIARNCQSDVNVLALIGERGHEVNDFIRNVLGAEGMKRSVIVVATSDQTPLIRLRAAFLAATVAEYFAGKGRNVLYLMDSITRLAMAAREIGLSIGEPPTTKGYPPSVFSMMPRLLERAGSFGKGSITAIISVLLEADDLQDPIGDAVRGVLDGHIVLDRRLATRGQYPAIDVNESLSRWMHAVTPERHQALARRGRKVLAEYRDAEDLINVGAYVRGSNPDIDEAIALVGPLRRFLAQGIHERVDHAAILGQMEEVLGQEPAPAGRRR